MKSCLIFISLQLWAFISLAQSVHIVSPADADSLVSTPINYHFAYYNSLVSNKGKLFIFLPGTGGVPYNYRQITAHAANLGYHSFGLTYPNAEAVNYLCAGYADTTCHSRARWEIFDGQDRSNEVQVDSINCIKRRAVKLLQYLDSHFPSENWGQYFTGDSIIWNKVILSGHSQGGGHAAFISKIRPVHRVVMFGAMDWVGLLNRNADWITWPGATPDSAYFGFTHQQDEQIDWNKQLITWNNYGMNAFGNALSIDTSLFPYRGSHMLTTLEIPMNDTTKYHGCVVTDNYTPMTGSTPLFAQVWTYLISQPNTSIDLPKNEIIEAIYFYPNPARSMIHFSDYIESITLLDTDGRIIHQAFNQKEINLSNLSKGIYFIRIIQGNFSTSQRILIQ